MGGWVGGWVGGFGWVGLVGWVWVGGLGWVWVGLGKFVWVYNYFRLSWMQAASPFRAPSGCGAVNSGVFEARPRLPRKPGQHHQRPTNANLKIDIYIYINIHIIKYIYIYIYIYISRIHFGSSFSPFICRPRNPIYAFNVRPQFRGRQPSRGWVGWRMARQQHSARQQVGEWNGVEVVV